jgi:hypothetical protein
VTDLAVTDLTSERVLEAVLAVGTVKKAAEELGCRREDLYRRFPGVIREAQERLRKARTPRQRVGLHLDKTMVQALDKRANGDRGRLVRTFLTPLPDRLPLPMGLSGPSKVVHLTLLSDAVTTIQTASGDEWSGVLRALIRQGLEKTHG